MLAMLLCTVSLTQDPVTILDADLRAPAAVVGARGAFEAGPDGLRCSSATTYDNAAFAEPWCDGRLTIELTLTHESGHLGAGLMFCCREGVAPPQFGHMVRIDGASELLFGHFLFGQFVADGRAPLAARVALGQRVALRVTVDPDRTRYEVHLDGQRAGGDMPLRFLSGRVAVQASLGVVDFHRLRITAQPAAAGPRWPERIECHEGRPYLVERDGTTFALPATGEPAAPVDHTFPPRRPRTELAGWRIAGPYLAHERGPRFAAAAVGGMAPADLARGADGSVWVLDLVGRRAIEVPAPGDRDEPRLHFSASGVSVDPPRATALFDAGGALLAEGDAGEALGPLRPGGRYSLHVPRGYEVLPGREVDREIAFVAPPGAGQLRLRRLRLVAGVFSRVHDGEAAEPPLIDDGARIERELRDAARWYFHHSRYRLWLDLRVVHRREPVTAAELSTTGEPNGEPPRAVLESLAAEAGWRLGDVDGLFVIADYRRAGGDRRPRVGRGGGLTLGAHGRGHGVSWWYVPEAPGYNGWLFCHEFHHQLDALQELSGFPDYPFNHFAPSLGNTGRFGEHWDGNRWILRGWPEHRWDLLAFGEPVTVVDADGDGLPDADEQLPFDERRFGSSPERVDTDGDGVGDREEAGFGSWLVHSGFEDQLGTIPLPNPRQADTDGDGRADRDDVLPLLPFDPVLTDGAWLALGERDDPLLHDVRTALRLDDGRLTVRAESLGAAGLEVRLLLDLDGDGWFEGARNVRVVGRGSGARVEEVLDASSPTEWPRADAAARDDFEVALERTTGAVELHIRAEPWLRPGRTVGLALMYRGRLSPPGLWSSWFEPHRLVRFTLR